MEKTLYLTFMNEAGRRQSLTLADPVEELDAGDVEDAMELIIEKNIFRGSGGELMVPLEAKVVGKTEELIFTTA